MRSAGSFHSAMNPTAIGPARSVAHARYLSSTCCSTSPRIAVEWRARPCFWPGPREYMRPVQCSCSTKDHPTRTSSTGISAVLKVVPDSADHSTRSFDRTLAALVCVVATLASSGAAGAAIHEEPANALSIPTWIIHISSVVEWTSAMLLMWKYAEATGNEKWKGMTWGMMPLFAGALSACTYHFFYNNPKLDFLVALQAGLTWIGNATLWAAAYRIYKGSQTEKARPR